MGLPLWVWVEKTVHGVKTDWLSCKKKVLGIVIRKESHIDHPLGHERTHESWFPWKRCNCTFGKIHILSIYLSIYSWMTIVESNPKTLFSIAIIPRWRGGCYSFLRTAPFTLYPYLIMLSIIKYHVLSLWYDLTWKSKIQSQIESYQRLKKWYLMLPCLTLNIIRYGLKVNRAVVGKE